MAGLSIQIPGVELLEELGHGTYSVVHRARRGDSFYAVKMPLRNETGIKLKILGRRFRREAVALARLRHPLLPRVMEVGVVDRAPYIIMELATGETLADRIVRGPLGEDAVVELGCQLASVLTEVHESGLVHRDVKPRNIVFDASTGRIRLVDFGFAASIDAAFRVLEPVGTLEYAAPEQVSDLRQRVDGRADLYAVGCVMYECLAQSPPFPDLDPKRLLFQHRGHQIPDVREIVPHVSGAMASILRRLLARSPDDRYANAAALLYDLEHIDEMRSGGRTTSTYGNRQRTTSLVPLLGRHKELTRLRRDWADVEAGHSRVAVLRGQTGSGKTRLVQALMDHAIGRGHKTLGARCHAWDPRPFSAIREIVEGNSHDLSEHDQGKAAEHLRNLAGDLAPLLKVLSPTIATMLVDVAPVPQSQDAQHIFVEGLAEFLSKLFREIGPAVVFVDDLQWLDAGSRRVFRRALDRVEGSKILFLFSSRGEPGEIAEVDRFLEGLEFTQINLDKLAENDIVDLIGAYLGDSVLDADLIRSVLQLSDHTPLSTLEILRMMLDDGHLLPFWGSWKFDVDAVMKMHLPPSTLGVLERRIETLDDMTKATLRAAAVTGMTFFDRLLPPICGLEEGHTTAALAEARRAMLVEPARLGTHRFVHDSVREVLLKGMTEEDLREAHQRAAEAMDGVVVSQDSPRSSMRPSAASLEPPSLSDGGSVRPSSVLISGDPDADACYTLASHYARGIPGRTPQRIYETNVAAGRLAFHTFDNERALDFFVAAQHASGHLELTPDPALNLLIGEARLRVGALERSREQFTGVLRMTSDPLHQTWALSRIAWIYQLQFDSAHAWEYLQQAFAKLEQRCPTDSLWAAVASWLVWLWSRVMPRRQVVDDLERQRLEAVCSLYYQAARLASLDEKPIRIVKSALSGVVPAERLGPSTSLARIYVTLSFVFTALGRRKTGRYYLKRAEDVARSTADPVAIAHALQVHSVVAAWEGNLRDAIETGQRCLEEYGHWRELSEYCVLACNQHLLLEMCGHSVEAWEWMARVVDRVEHHEGDPFLSSVLELAAHASLTCVGREDEAETRLKKLRELTIRVPDNSGFQTWTYVPRLRIFTERGDFGVGFEELVAEFDGKKLNPRRVHLGVTQYYIHLAHARVHAILRASEDRRKPLLDKLASALRDLKAGARIPVILAHAQVVEAYHSMFLGARAKAVRLFARAEALAQKENAPWVLYAVHRGRAHLLQTDGLNEAARDQARIAEVLAAEHGMMYRLRWIREEFNLVREPHSLASENLPPLLPRAIADRVQGRSEGGGGQLRTLLRLTESVPENLDSASQVHAILNDLIHGLRAERGFLFLSRDGAADNGAAAALKYLAGQDAEGNSIKEPDAPSRSLVDEAFTAWTFAGDGAASYLLTATPTRAMVAAPISVDDVVIGAVCLDREAAPFVEAEGELLVVLASQVPVALEFARALRSRQRAEQELQRAQKLEAMGRLARGVARDFGRVLMDIRTSTDALMSSNVNGSLERIQSIQRAASHAEELTRHLVEFSSSGAQRLELVSIDDRIRRSMPLLEELLGPAIALTVRLGLDVHMIKAEVGQIDRMLVALAMRARDVTTHGGAFIVETANATLDETDIRTHPTAKAGRYVRISVSDTGRAIEPRAEKSMFEPFADEDDPSGGLALGTLYRNVVDCGGFIDIESIVGEGTTFRIYWPSTSERVNAKPIESEAPKLPRGTETILLVEPEPLTGDALGRVLKDLGYRVLMAHDGVEALKLVARRLVEIDMVIADAFLPGMNGFELGRELVKMRKTLRVVCLSDPAQASAANGHSSQHVEFLPKPVHQDALARRVREVLDRRVTS
jgi:serine/threonine protein kinase/signal transduction histidine kinase/ActR/RegA family two-component response regulator